MNLHFITIIKRRIIIFRELLVNAHRPKQVVYLKQRKKYALATDTVIVENACVLKHRRAFTQGNSAIFVL